MTLKRCCKVPRMARATRRRSLALVALSLCLPLSLPAEDTPVPPQTRPPEIQSLDLPQTPGAGKGRLAMKISGNRRWCTFPDDRLIQLPQRPGVMQKAKNEVFTFGYQFTIAAMRRGHADEPLMLFESPIFRTASWLPANKVGESKRIQPPGQVIISEGEKVPKGKQAPKGPESLVPFWQESYRCVTLPDHFDFDLDPGTYDVYAAFDLLNRDGGWVHRTTAYLTDVPVEEARHTRLESLVNIGPAAERQMELQAAIVEPDTAPSPGAADP